MFPSLFWKYQLSIIGFSSTTVCGSSLFHNFFYPITKYKNYSYYILEKAWDNVTLPVLCKELFPASTKIFSRSGQMWVRMFSLFFILAVSAFHLCLIMSASGFSAFHVRVFRSSLRKSSPLKPYLKKLITSLVFSSHSQPLILCKMWTPEKRKREKLFSNVCVHVLSQIICQFFINMNNGSYNWNVAYFTLLKTVSEVFW